METHEYAILHGLNRAKVGQIIGAIAAIISAGLVLLLLSAFDLAKKFGLPANVPPSLLSLLSAATIFGVIYWYFNTRLWRLKWVNVALRSPDIAGKYRCDGETLGPSDRAGHKWTADVTITQTWDRIRVHLKSGESVSYSIAAAIYRDPSEGFRLLYHYRNEPKMSAPQLRGHRGFTDLLFSSDLATAEGEYFNGQGRFTFGRMTLVRVE